MTVDTNLVPTDLIVDTRPSDEHSQLVSPT